MAELPSSWGLKTKRRNDGKLDIIGKSDAGQEYRVRTTDTSEVTEKDVSELKAADRESYSNPNTRVYDYIKHLTSNPVKEERDARDLDDWTEAAGPVIHAGFEQKGHQVGGGYSRQGQVNYANWIRSLGGN